VTLLSEIGLRIEARHIGAAGYVLPRDRGCVAFDADALAMPLHVRGRERGDRFRPFSERGERRLKTFLIDAKGKIKKIFSQVKPEDHAEDVLNAFSE